MGDRELGVGLAWLAVGVVCAAAALARGGDAD